MAMNSEDKLDILIFNFDESSVVSPPIKPVESGRYVVDTANVDWKHTIFCWRNHSSNWRHFVKETEDGDKSKWIGKKLPSGREAERAKGDGYIMKTTYYSPNNQENGSNSGSNGGYHVRRIITQMRLISNNTMSDERYALIEYMFPAYGAAEMKPRKRNGHVFIPTAPSIKKKIQDAVQTTATPTEINAKLSQKNVLDYVPGGTPRDTSQIKYYRRIWRKTDNQSDRVKEILNYCREKPEDEQVVKNLQFDNDSLRFVFAMSAQLDEIVRNCAANDSRCGILTIDSTLNVDDFDIAPTYYPINAIHYKETHQPVILPGPCLVHEKEMTPNAYMYFAHCLLEGNYDLKKICFIAGDRGEGQAKFALPFDNPIMIPCYRKIQNDIFEHIDDPNVANMVLKDIFGTDEETDDRLIDCPRELFDEIVNDLVDKWPEHFIDYFKNEIMAKIKDGMLLDVRESCGLSKSVFYSNAPVGFIHKKIQVKIIEKQALVQTETDRKYSCTLKDVMDIYKDLILQERNLLHQAVCGLGPYELAPDYQNLGFSQMDFALLTKEEKKLALCKVVPNFMM